MGIEGNENADRLAKMATTIQSENDFIPYTDLNEHFKKEMIENTRKTVKEQGAEKRKNTLSNDIRIITNLGFIIED